MAKKKSEAAFVVAQPFRDKDDFNKEHKVGDDVSHFEEQRLAALLGLGLIQQKGEAPKEPEAPVEPKEPQED